MYLHTENNTVSIVRESGEQQVVHPIWLRERITGDEAIDTQTLQRLYQPSDIPLDLTITHAALQPGSEQTVEVTFSDGLRASFSMDALQEDVDHASEWNPARMKRWKADINDIPDHDWQAVDCSDEALCRMLDDFYHYGFVIVSNVPKEKGFMHRFMGKFGVLRETHFGEVFDVETKPVYNDLAYTALGLTAHNDNNYRYHVPGIQVLHSIVNECDGGLSTLINGFAVAERLREVDPEAFEVLTQVEPRFRYVDSTTSLWGKGPMIQLDLQGELFQIRYSNRVEYVPLLSPERLAAYYRGRKTFCDLMNDREFVLEFRLKSGSLMMMDNHRVLHGRTAFDPQQGHRLLQGAYIDHDWPLETWNFLRHGSPLNAASAAA